MKNTIKKLLICAILASPLLGANAEPIKLLVPVPPGGLVDNLARLAGTELAKKLNENVVVENKPGASGSIATSAASAALPNGQTLVIGNNGTINMFPILNPGYDGHSPKSLTPVCLLGGGPLVLTASGSIPANNLKELLQYFKENPSKASWASPGVGTAPHLLGEQLKFQYGVDSMVHVLYKGMAPAQIDVIGDRVSLMFDLYGPQMASLISTGKLKPIFVTDVKPMGNIPAAPDASFNIRDWFGVFAPAGTPEPVLTKLRNACDSAVNDPAVKEKLVALGTPPLNIKPSDVQSYIDAERKRWAAIIDRLDLKEKK
jgi:tripartite-type tricarboxylate transporter receptor subunit TctC